MRMTRSPDAANRTGVTVLTADSAFEQVIRATFKTSAQIDLRVISGTVATAGDDIESEGATVIIDRKSVV